MNDNKKNKIKKGDLVVPRFTDIILCYHRLTLTQTNSSSPTWLKVTLILGRPNPNLLGTRCITAPYRYWLFTCIFTNRERNQKIRLNFREIRDGWSLLSVYFQTCNNWNQFICNAYFFLLMQWLGTITAVLPTLAPGRQGNSIKGCQSMSHSLMHHEMLWWGLYCLLVFLGPESNRKRSMTAFQIRVL